MPAIAYSEEQALALRYARSTVAEPNDVTDWVWHVVTDLPWQPNGCLSLISNGNRPFVAFVVPNGGHHLRYARGTKAAPDATDWLVSDGPTFPDAFFGMSMAAIGEGRSVAAYMAGGASDLFYMRSDLGKPTSPSDWQSHSVDGDDSVGYPCAIVEIDGRPAVAYGNDTRWWLMFAQALVPAPTGPGDWQLSVVDECSASISFLDLALVDGYPCIVYESDDDIYCAWAKTTQPLVPRDWWYSTAANSASDNYAAVSLTEIDGNPSICFYNSTAQVLMYAHGAP